MSTNPDNALGTNGAFGGRTSVNALNDVLSSFNGAGILSGWICSPSSGMTVTVGGDDGVRDVAIAQDPNGNKTTINNISASPVEVEIASASSTSARYDSIVAYVNSPATVDDTTLDNPGAVGIIAVEGSASDYPDDDAIRSAITSDGGTGTTAYYVVLAKISIPASTTTITTSEITVGDHAGLISDNIDWTSSIESVDVTCALDAGTISSNQSVILGGKIMIVSFAATGCTIPAANTICFKLSVSTGRSAAPIYFVDEANTYYYYAYINNANVRARPKSAVSSQTVRVFSVTPIA